VIDRTYVNNKITSPQADVVRLTANLKQVNGEWKISEVSASGSAGSNVPGQ
jgi:ABC-type transporter MlaC component